MQEKKLVDQDPWSFPIWIKAVNFCLRFSTRATTDLGRIHSSLSLHFHKFHVEACYQTRLDSEDVGE